MSREWQIGDYVAFSQDGLKARGLIIKVMLGTVIVLIDENIEGGWCIDSDTGVSPKYIGKRGWGVNKSRLILIESKKTKLGNEL